MSLSSRKIDDAAPDAISAEVADIHAGDDLLDRIHDRVAPAPARWLLLRSREDEDYRSRRSVAETPLEAS
ncbi:MAG: hypothetical protein M3445_05830 [Actinomycetota bacterium]|nr:hypothetical protein [Actinomycetota bacterium]